MAHLGLRPQSVHAMGGYRVQGRTDEDAERLLFEAESVEKAGAFAIVLEGVPSDVAARITEAVSVPTIGIGAGPHCDAPGAGPDRSPRPHEGSYPKFAKPYVDLRGQMLEAIGAFRQEVAEGAFPDEAHSYH